MQKNYLVKELEDLYKTGIYKITCLVNNKIYIGIARATKGSKSRHGFYCRWQYHINHLNKNKHVNTYLQNAWNKYKSENFIFEILEICTKDICEIREIHYINLYNTLNPEFGYNILYGNIGYMGKRRSKEHNKKISDSLKGKKRPLDVVKKYSNEVQQLDENMNVIAIYYSMSEASRQTGIMRQDIGQAIIGKKFKKAGGFYWRKVKDIV